jgi:exopolysaccharide biosynthesis polyprenyl glycosylphosphotransferase
VFDKFLGELVVNLPLEAPIFAALAIQILIVRQTRFTPALAKRAVVSTKIRKKTNAFWRDASSDRVELDRVGTSYFSSRIERTRYAAQRPGKRLIDIVAATALLVLFAPVMILTAILIKLDSKGPVLYRQQRIGLGGRPFEILKFRSMVADAEKDGVAWARKNDSRVTRVGRVIRQLRIDEMPQAINVLRGEMSFVGPRPERPEFVRMLEKEIPNYGVRHVVRPGITGWAQVKYVYTDSVEDARVKQEFDMHYIENFSLWRDLVIMAMTIRVALLGIGSR